MINYYFRLNISYQAFEQLYRTPNTVIKVRAEDGKTLQMPAKRFVPFFSQAGVRGRFELAIDEKNKFESLKQVGQ